MQQRPQWKPKLDPVWLHLLNSSLVNPLRYDTGSTWGGNECQNELTGLASFLLSLSCNCEILTTLSPHLLIKYLMLFCFLRTMGTISRHLLTLNWLVSGWSVMHYLESSVGESMQRLFLSWLSGGKKSSVSTRILLLELQLTKTCPSADFQTVLETHFLWYIFTVNANCFLYYTVENFFL